MTLEYPLLDLKLPHKLSVLVHHKFGPLNLFLSLLNPLFHLDVLSVLGLMQVVQLVHHLLLLRIHI